MSSSFPTIHKTPWDTPTYRIFEIVAEAPGCQLAYVAQLLPDVTLRDLLKSLCYLKHSRQLDLVLGKQGALFLPFRRDSSSR
jgi:hypothetical protein